MIKLSEKLNILFLMAAQGVKLLLLLISLYLASGMGQELWGQYATTQALLIWLGLLIEYGFNVSAITKMASIGSEDVRPLSFKILSESTSARLIIAGLIFIVGILATFVFPSLFSLQRVDLCLVLLTALAYALLPSWYMQFTQRNFVVALVDIFIAIISAILLILLASNDLNLLAVLFGQLISTVIALVVVVWMVYREIGRPVINLGGGFLGIRRDFSYFIYNSSVGLFTSANTILINILFGVAVAGHYASVERILRVINSLAAPFIKVYFPKYAVIYNEDRRGYEKRFRKLLKSISLIFGSVTLFFILNSNSIARLVYGERFFEIGNILRVSSITIFLVNLNAILCFFWIIPSKKIKIFNVMTLITAIINFSLLVYFVHFNPGGFAWSIVVAESVLFGWLVTLKILDSKGASQ